MEAWFCIEGNWDRCWFPFASSVSRNRKGSFQRDKCFLQTSTLFLTNQVEGAQVTSMRGVISDVIFLISAAYIVPHVRMTSFVGMFYKTNWPIFLLKNQTKPNQKQVAPGLPWWCSGWESACQCRGHGFEPWSGRIPHAVERLGPWATIAEPAHLEPVLRNRRGRDGERPAHRDEEWPPLAATRESPRTEMKTQHTHK